MAIVPPRCLSRCYRLVQSGKKKNTFHSINDSGTYSEPHKLNCLCKETYIVYIIVGRSLLRAMKESMLVFCKWRCKVGLHTKVCDFTAIKLNFIKLSEREKKIMSPEQWQNILSLLFADFVIDFIIKAWRVSCFISLDFFRK